MKKELKGIVEMIEDVEEERLMMFLEDMMISMNEEYGRDLSKMNKSDKVYYEILKSLFEILDRKEVN